MESSTCSNKTIARIAIFQASWPLQLHTVYEALALAKANYLVDLFLYNVDQRVARLQFQSNKNITVYYFESPYAISNIANNISGIGIFYFYDLLFKLYKKIIRVFLIYFPSLVRVIMRMREKHFIWLQSEKELLPSVIINKSLKILKCQKYKAFIGIEKLGLIWAGKISKYQNIPYIYHSLELYTWDHSEYLKSHPKSRRLKLTEEKYHKKSYATIIQDKQRAEVLFRDNGIQNARVVYMPISAPDKPLQRSLTLQQKFNISDDKIIILQFGLIKETRFSLELAKEAQKFIPKWFLVFHGIGEDSIINQIQILDVNKRIIVSQDLVPEDNLHELISSAHIGLVLYRSFPLNDYLTAFSSEKIALQLRAGLPIIAFNYPGYEIIEETRCGILINSLDEIPPAIEKILESYSEFSNNARQCFIEYYEFSKNIKNVVQFIDEMP